MKKARNWNVSEKHLNRMRHLQSYKIKIGCSHCGYNHHPMALVLDHLNPADKALVIKNGRAKNGMKGGGFFNLARPPHTIRELIAEIRKCRVLCKICDVELNFDENPFYRLQKYNDVAYFNNWYGFSSEPILIEPIELKPQAEFYVVL